jgi:hypothetical protein
MTSTNTPAYISRRLRDQLGNADIKRTATAAAAIVNTLQNQPGLLPGEFAGAVTAAYLLLTEAARLDGDLPGLVRAVMADANGRRPEFKAVKNYIEEEVLHVH